MKNRNRHHPSRIIPVVLLTAALLTGCGGSAKKQSAEVSASAEPTPSAETISYTGKTYHEFEFQIPDTWFDTSTESDKASYLPNGKTSDVVLQLSFLKGSGTMADEATQKAIEDKIETNGYNKVSSGAVMVSGDHAGYQIQYKMKGNNNQVLQDNMLLFDARDGVVVMEFGMIDGTQDKYQPICDAVVASIMVNPEASISAEPTTQTEEKAASTPAATEDSVSFREAMDSYEAFFDEYVAFMQKYKASNDAASMLADYSSFLTRYADVMQKIGAIDSSKLSADDAAYYLQVMARIEQKLASIQ
jgi:hypothetical protein